MDEVLFLTYGLKERIWGGDYFKKVMKVTESEEPIGELWSCSGHKAFESVILNGTYKGKTLREVFKEHRELFKNSSLDEFPILIKLIAARDKLSVQVHPSDEYALKNEGQYGKTEGWLILDKKEDSSLIIGHNAKNKEELENYVKNDDFKGLLKEVKVNIGDFFSIEAGTIHAIGKNIVLLEVQQSSDVTYRFYDYHRVDKNGNERELHIKKACEVTSFVPYDYNVKNINSLKTPSLWKNKYFEVDYINVDGSTEISNEEKDYLILTVAEGEVELEGRTLKYGESAILTSNCQKALLKGKGKVIISKSLI